MELVPVNCNNCGAALDIGPGTHFITCGHCGSRLAVKRTAAAAYTEVLDRLERKTDALAAKVNGLALLNEVERIDRDWEQEKEQYMILGKNGVKCLPSRPVGWLLLVGLPLLGLVLNLSAKKGAMTAQFPFVGVMFIGLGIVLGIYQLWKAAEYEAARDLYFARRERALNDHQPPDAPG